MAVPFIVVGEYRKLLRAGLEAGRGQQAQSAKRADCTAGPAGTEVQPPGKRRTWSHAGSLRDARARCQRRRSRALGRAARTAPAGGVSGAARRRALVQADLPADVCFSLVSAMRNPQLAALA